MPTRPLARVAALLVVLALLLPAAAGAQQAPSLGAPTETQAPVVTTSTNTADRGLKTWQELLIFGAGLILLVGIAVAIIGDARERAPVEERRRDGGLETAGGTRVPPHERRRRKEQARAKGRAARRARKQNR
jgi:hypothetical protein